MKSMLRWLILRLILIVIVYLIVRYGLIPTLRG